MKKSSETGLLGIVSFVLVVGGVSGLLHQWLGWIHFFGFVRFLVPGGYEVFGYVVMVVLGIAIGAASERTRKSGA